MATRLLTDRAEVEGRLGRSLTPEEDARFDSAVLDVSAYMYAVAPRIPREPDPIPDVVVGVASNLVIERLAAPPGEGVTQESLGGYSVTYRSSAESAAAQLMLLAPWRGSRIGIAQVDPSKAVAQ